MGGNTLLFYFIFQAIWNSLEGYYLLVEKIIILVEKGTPLSPPWKIPAKYFFVLFTPSLTKHVDIDIFKFDILSLFGILASATESVCEFSSSQIRIATGFNS